MNSLSIRKARPEDLNDILDLFEKSIRKTCASDYNSGQIEVWVSSRQNISRWLDKINDLEFVLVYDEDELQGFAALEKPGYVDVFYVHPSAQRKGIGKFMLSHLETLATTEGAICLWTEASITAKPFFETMGYVEVRPNEARRDDIVLKNYVMQKFTEFLPPNLLFFDGICSLCNKSVDFLIRHDHGQTLKFAPLQGVSASNIPSVREESKNSLIFLQKGKKYTESTAVIKVALELGNKWKWMALGFLLPPFVRNFLYKIVARFRYRIFGQFENCRLPTEAEKSRFLL